MHKLAVPAGDDEWVPHSYAPLFTIEATSAQTRRLVTGVPGGDVVVLGKLIECLEAPFYILYVLHTPLGEGNPGRYQSPLLQDAELKAFLSRYAAFFKGDARFDLWVHSPSSNGTLAWDRHNLIYGYGPVECFTNALHEIGFSEGKPHIPRPHQHFYRHECDADASNILSEFSWNYSPLHPEDEQRL